MPVHLFRLLDEGVEVRPWLERQLVGPDLLEVVRELAALRDGGGAGDASAALPAGRRGEVLEHGLSALTDDEVQALFRRPELLLQLQEWVLVDGGPYWDGVLSGCAAGLAATPPPLAPPRPRPPVRRSRVWAFVTHAGVAAAAAAVVWLLVRPHPASPPREEGGGIAAASADAVLPTLAEQIDRQWAAVRRREDTAAALREMRQTCEALLAAPLPQLSQPERAAVRHDLARLEREIESQRRALEQGGDRWRARAALDSRVNLLISRRWRDPQDLPDSDSDPDDLPGLDT
jgi:hypothetical protein